MRISQTHHLLSLNSDNRRNNSNFRRRPESVEECVFRNGDHLRGERLMEYLCPLRAFLTIERASGDVRGHLSGGACVESGSPRRKNVEQLAESFVESYRRGIAHRPLQVLWVYRQAINPIHPRLCVKEDRNCLVR